MKVIRSFELFIDLVKMASFCTENLNSMLEYMVDTVVSPKPSNFRTESLISPATESSGGRQLTAEPTPNLQGLLSSQDMAAGCSILGCTTQPCYPI